MRMCAVCSPLSVWFVLLFTACVNAQQTALVDDFARADSLYHGNGWETINPGCWKIENHALRRRSRSSRPLSIRSASGPRWFRM